MSTNTFQQTMNEMKEYLHQEKIERIKKIEKNKQPEFKNTNTFEQIGIASWYNEDLVTATGEKFDRYKFTAAHNTLPLNTKIRVTNLENGKQVIVRINDTGGFGKNKYNKKVKGESMPRILDCSEVCARKLGYANKGWALVKIEVIKLGKIPNPMLRKNKIH
jgi:rare lipoprotein A